MEEKNIFFTWKNIPTKRFKDRGFKSKESALTFLTEILDKKVTDFKNSPELLNYIEKKRNQFLDIGVDVVKTEKIIKKGERQQKKFEKSLNKTKNILDKVEAKLPIKKYHITAEIHRNATYTPKNGKIYDYKGKDKILDSRIIEARTEQGAQEIMNALIHEDFDTGERNYLINYDVNNIEFLDSVNESSLTSQHPSEMPMRQVGHVQYSFTNEETKFLNDTNTCAIDNFIGVYGETLKMTRDDLIKLNKTFHYNNYEDEEEIESNLGDMIINPKYKEYILEDSFTPLFFEYICKEYDIAHYAYDIDNNCFMKATSKNRNHPAVCYYAINNHMYLVKDTKAIKSLIERAKDQEHKFNTSLLEFEVPVNKFSRLPVYENPNIDDIDIEKMESCIFMFSRTIHNINDILEKFITKYNYIPVIQKNIKTNINQFMYTIKKKLHLLKDKSEESIWLKETYFIFTCDPNDINKITYKDVKELCTKLNVEWKNQTYVQFLTEVKNRFFEELSGRIKFKDEQRVKIAQKFKFKCNICKCCIKETKFEIDHIRSLANGGTNEEPNLQPLCKPCHKDKCKSEHEDGSYMRINDTESSYNSSVQSVMDSQLSFSHAFIEPIIYDPLKIYHSIFNIDINKCRKNILYHGESNYCVFTVFDKVEEYNGVVDCGVYFVESDNYLPLHGNGWYYHNMINYCLEEGIIKHEDIKFKIKSSLTIKPNYFNKFIDYCYTNMGEYSKLMVNSMIGAFKPNSKREHWKSLCITNNSCEAFNNYIKNKGCFIHPMNINDKLYYHVLNKTEKTNMETEAPLYNQVVQQEQIELHKLIKIVESKKGTILSVNTDCVACTFPDNKLPFEIVEEIQLNGHYWDDEGKVYKYKLEYKEVEKQVVSIPKMMYTKRTETYTFGGSIMWNLQNDVKDNDFKPLVDKIMSSNQSWCVEGAGGTGKSTLVKMLQKEMTDKELNFVSLAPTNLAALIIDGTTIHKFSSKIKSYKALQGMKFDYIFVDEISMLKEIFYKFILMAKKVKLNVKIIMVGDYNQLEPINDRIGNNIDYGNSQALREICDNNKILLTTCRRADDEFFNLVKYDNIPNLLKTDFINLYDYTHIQKHLAFTNAARIHINNIMMIKRHKTAKRHSNKFIELNKLIWDEQSQDVILNTKTPIICKITNEEADLINNERFIITNIEGHYITIKNKRKTMQFNTVTNDMFQRCFRVAYASTVHSAQGLTINEPYVLWEWSKYSQKMKYVALSRATKKELIHIV